MAGFHKFFLLPPELRLAIWEAAIASPAMHVFDVCMPELNGHGTAPDAAAKTDKRADVAFMRKTQKQDGKEIRYSSFKHTAFFDALANEHDPSMYRWKMALASTCIDARRIAASSPGRSLNSVYLPGPECRILYDNATDVLHLRFGATLSCPKLARLPLLEEEERPQAPSTSYSLLVPEPAAEEYVGDGLLSCQWSAELAETVRTARQIAIDAGQTDSLVKVYNNPIFLDEIHMLASTMSCALENLYLVESCGSGACQGCKNALTKVQDQTTEGSLYDGLNIAAAPSPLSTTAKATVVSDTPPARIYGVDKVYNQVFDLENLGWTDLHPAYIFGKALGKAIREQQADLGRVVFKGVKVLTVEN